LLVLGIWWRRLSVAGALAGMAVGGVLATTAVVLTLVAGPIPGWGGALLGQPAAWSVPITFATMIGVSLLTPGQVPPGTARTLGRLHTPEVLRRDSSDQSARARP
jgi:cation/acetate symporter